MKAAVLNAFGSPLSVETVPDPVLGTGEVIVDVAASGVLSYTDEVLSGARNYQLALPANDRVNQRMVRSECRNDSIVHVGKVVRIERQSGHSADVDVKGSLLAKRRSPSCKSI